MGCSGSVKAAEKCMLKATKEAAAKYQQVQQQYLSYLQARNAWQMLLGSFIGIYSLIKSYEMYKEQLKIAKEILRQQEDYLTLAKRHYDEINLPSFERVRDLYDRYVVRFQNYEDRFMQEAFRLVEYDPDYDVQEGRVFSKVQTQFDRSYRMRLRARGKYQAGRPCRDATWISVMAALAKVDAINHSYRYEEAKKRDLDQWYWNRWRAGAQFETDLANRAVSGLNRGVAVSVQGLNAVGAAYTNVMQAGQMVMEGYQVMGSFWASIANGAFRMAGYGAGSNSMMGWMPPPYGGGAYGLYGPGMTNFSLSGNGTVGLGISAGGYIGLGTMLGDNHGGGTATAGGFAGPMISMPEMPGLPGAPAAGNWIGAPGYSSGT
jgi:hypothetical protein